MSRISPPSRRIGVPCFPFLVYIPCSYTINKNSHIELLQEYVDDNEREVRSSIVPLSV